MKIRTASREDGRLLLPLFEAFYGPYFEPRTADAIAGHLAAAASVDTVLLATIDDHAAGFASLRLIPQIESDSPHAELSDIYVADAHRRSGVGTALMRTAEDLARDHGARRVHLTAGTENDGARAFYRSLGYADFAVAMKKELEE